MLPSPALRITSDWLRVARLSRRRSKNIFMCVAFPHCVRYRGLTDVQRNNIWRVPVSFQACRLCKLHTGASSSTPGPSNQIVEGTHRIEEFTIRSLRHMRNVMLLIAIRCDIPNGEPLILHRQTDMVAVGKASHTCRMSPAPADVPPSTIARERCVKFSKTSPTSARE